MKLLYLIFLIPTLVTGEIQDFKIFLHSLVPKNNFWESQGKIIIDRNFSDLGLSAKLHLTNTTINLENSQSVDINCEEYFCNILIPSLSFSTDFKLKYMLNGKESNYNGQLFSTFTTINLEINNPKLKNDCDSCNAYITLETAKFDVKLMDLDLSEFISNYLDKNFIPLLKQHKNVLMPYFSKEIRRLFKILSIN